MGANQDEARDYLETLLTEVQALRDTIQTQNEILVEQVTALRQNNQILSHLAEGAGANRSPVADLLREGAAAFMQPNPRGRRRNR